MNEGKYKEIMRAIIDEKTDLNALILIKKAVDHQIEIVESERYKFEAETR